MLDCGPVVVTAGTVVIAGEVVTGVVKTIVVVVGIAAVKIIVVLVVVVGDAAAVVTDTVVIGVAVNSVVTGMDVVEVVCSVLAVQPASIAVITKAVKIPLRSFCSCFFFDIRISLQLVYNG
jgi:hypothetical protein